MDEELRAYLETAAEQKMAAGLPREAAVRAARVEIGSVDAIKEGARDVGWESTVETVWQDIRYAFRTLRKSPGFTVPSVATLALAIGANTAMFSVVNAVLLRPLPYRSPEQLAMLWVGTPGQNRQDFQGRPAYLTVEEWRRQSKSFADIAVRDPVSVTLTDTDGAEKISVVRVSPNFFPLLGVQPLHGRSFSNEEAEQRRRLALISHRFWQTRFGGSHDAIGTSILLDGLPSQIIGILPASFVFGCGCVGAAYIVCRLGNPSQHAQRGFVVCHWETATGRDCRSGPGGDERHRTRSRRGVAGGRPEPGSERRPVKSESGWIQIAAGIVDADRRGVLCAPHRRRQRHEPLAGAQRRPRARDGHSSRSRRESSSDRAPAPRRKRDAGLDIGRSRVIAGIGRHSPHPSLSGPPTSLV